MAVQQEFTVQGMRFRLKPTSRKNVTALEKHFLEPTKELLEADQYEQWIEALRVVAEPHPNDPTASFDNIDVEDFDIKLAEKVIEDFMPALTLTAARLAGSTRS